MKYYGLIENLTYGFVEEDDNRITDKFIEITDEYHQQLLDEASEGLEIVSDNKTVFTAKPNLYFVNAQGLWEKKNEEDYEEELKQQERERIAKLNLTGADVERGIYQAKGMDFEDVIMLVETLQQAEDERVANIDLKALKIELKANNFYRGNPYVDAVGVLLGFTEEQLDKFFEYNDYTYLQ